MIKLRFDSKIFKAELSRRIQAIEEAMLSRLELIGEEFVNQARSKVRTEGGFGDVTGNLRSSIGYMILYNGKPVKSSEFESVSNGSEGSITGKKFIQSLRKNYQDSQGFVFIGVAGMDYAAAVESKGYDVITGTSIATTSALNKAFKQIP